MGILDTGVKNAVNVSRYTVGSGSIRELDRILRIQKIKNPGPAIAFVDEFFSGERSLRFKLGLSESDHIHSISTKTEPTTDAVDDILKELRDQGIASPSAIVGFGGGITMDIAKAISNLYNNPGRAADYQGWDLLKAPGVYKIGIPTISGTGAEATRTCVMTNTKSGLKLGMNSDFTVFNQILMDPDLSSSVPRDQFFFTGMDAYIHCIEALSGNYRNAIGDAYSRETVNLCKRVFSDQDMTSSINRERLMVASYLGGCAIATSYVGLVHPFSAGLSVVLGLHHCVANCVVMRAMRQFYPREFDEFWLMAEAQRIEIPKGVCSSLTADQYEKLYLATIIHQKPLTNALGDNFNDILTKDKVHEIFSLM